MQMFLTVHADYGK